MSRLWIVSAGGHGAVVAEAAVAARQWDAIAFVDDRHPALGPVLGHPVVGTTADLLRQVQASPDGPVQVVIALGDNTRRLQLSESLRAAGATLATVIHPFTAISPSASIGEGSVVLAGATVNARARIGLAAIVNTRASVDHDCTVGDGVHLCPGSTLAGTVTVRDRVWLGIGACAIQGVTIGEGAVVGAGSAVIRDVRAGATVAGCPAKEIKHVV
jgi:sugar O-acyltransferase (sialic acid O-acetyltransferase NeuD family)